MAHFVCLATSPPHCDTDKDKESARDNSTSLASKAFLLCQIFTNFKQFFTDRLCNKPFIIRLLTTPPHLTYLSYTTLEFITCNWLLSSVLWRCWLGGRKGNRPVKKVVGCWCGCLSEARCRLAYSPADAMPLTVSCFSKIQIGFTFLVLDHMGSPGKGAVKRLCVRACFLTIMFYTDVWQHIQGVVGLLITIVHSKFTKESSSEKNRKSVKIW